MTDILWMLGIDNEEEEEECHINVITLDEYLKIQPDHQTNIRFESGCNGILCMTTDHTLVLWNPSVKKQKLLTLPKIDKYTQVRFGIGYDPSVNDYKIIKFMKKIDHTKSTYYCEVEVLTLKSNEWRRLSYALPYVINIWSRPVTVKGAMYWLAYRQQEDGILEEKEEIVSFDLASETCSIVELPCQRKSGLMEVEGKLGCFYKTRNSLIDVWVMEENQTWVKSITISNPFIMASTGFCMHDIAVLGSPDVDASFKKKVMNLKFLCSYYTVRQPKICCAASLMSFD